MKNHVTQSYLFQGPFGDTGAAGDAGIVGSRVSNFGKRVVCYFCTAVSKSFPCMSLFNLNSALHEPF